MTTDRKKVYVVRWSEDYNEDLHIQIFSSLDGAQKCIDEVVLEKGKWKQCPNHPEDTVDGACIGSWRGTYSRNRFSINLLRYELMP